VQGIANMVGWHDAAQGQQVANWWDNGNNAIAFSRGNQAWIGINNSADAVTSTFTTGLAPGAYCDVIHGDPSSGGCTGATVTVGSAGTATVTVPAHDAVALYGTGSGTSTPTGPPAGTVTEHFDESETPPAGLRVYLVGSVPGLADWDPARAIPLDSTDGTHWTASVDLPANGSFAYKYILKDAAGNVTWESGDNRSADTGSAGGTLDDTWK
jgi:alpha-amylase